ncbi:phage terminase small subunit [Motiliproteus sp.]|uniref:phage terminase small subunit n=1 Tax=Motiliproteus sp. TaxID=1898955 RepID=UPI003BAD7A5B
MKSPCQAHFERETAKQQTTQDSTANRANLNQQELMMAMLYEHRSRLKGIESLQAKAALKVQLLPEYAPYVDGILAGNSGQPDDVLMSVMVWRMDVNDWDGALAIAQYALDHGLSLPDQYQRSTACLIAEEVAECAIKSAKDDETQISLEVVERVQSMTIDHDMPDQVRAKLFKAIGYLVEPTDPEQALVHLKTALKYHEKVGVKQDIKRIESALKKQQQQNTGDADNGST